MAIRYLVEKDGKQHLPVSGEDGKLDHHLMGAAWAALHEGFRGNKYEGPDKEEAIKKLTALYHEEKMELPGGSPGGSPSHVKGKAVALTGLSTTLKAGADADLWIVYIPKGDKTVDQLGEDGAASKLRVNPSVLSAKRMEAARRLIAGRGGNQPYTDYNHDDKEASGRPLRFAWHDDLGVIGLTRRTPAALKATTGDPPEFQAFSPHVPIDPDTGEALGIYMNCGGFVNRPLFGDQTSLSAAAHLPRELVAADANAVELVSAAPGDETTKPAAEEKKTMDKLIAKLRGAFAKPGASEDELIAEFDREHGSIAALTARAGLAEPVIVALGFEKTATPKPEELTARITALSKPVDETVIGKELVGFAISIGVIAPAEKEEWEGKLARDRKGWQPELVKKTPSVLLGRVIKEQAAGAAAGAKGKTKWEDRVEELCAKDPVIAPIATKDLVRAKSMALERIAREEPGLLKT